MTDTPTTGPLSRTCPRCKAEPGQPCITTTKRPYKGHHAARLTRREPTTGRPTLCTPELTDHICSLLTAGTTLRTAATAAGIGQSTLFNWLNRGQSDHPDHRPYREFLERVTQARARGSADMARNIYEAGLPREKPMLNPVTGNQATAPDGEPLYEIDSWDWKAHAWILERSYHGEWGKRSTLEITGGEDLGAVAGGQVASALSTGAATVARALEAARERGELPPRQVIEGEVEAG